jgi:cyclopropane fatty-acyl-phospholipid synthase-like methyltransferase
VSLTLRGKTLSESLELYNSDYFNGDRDLSEIRIAETVRLLGNVEGKTILDLGCGTGEGSTLLKKLGANVVSTDISKIAASRCQNNRLDSILSATHSLPFANNSFDGVLFTDVIEHIPRPLVSQTLAEIKRITKTGGNIAIHTMPTVFLEKLSEFYGLINRQHWRRFGEQGGHINTYTVWKLKRDLGIAGLRISKLKIGDYPSSAPFSNVVTPCSRPFKVFIGNDLWVCCIS